VATSVGNAPPVGSLFAAFLGYNPMQSMLGSQELSSLSPSDAQTLTGKTFFPSLISGPFHDGLVVAFAFAIGACLVAALASWLMGARFVHADDQHEMPDVLVPDEPEPSGQGARQ
jgi:hypothetical protein